MGREILPDSEGICDSNAGIQFHGQGSVDREPFSACNV
jgi:hypothetical protein